MKILIAGQKRAFCLYVPLGLLCNRVGAALLAGGLQRTQLLPDGTETAETAIVTRDQAYAMLKALKQSKQTLKASGLPLVDIEQSDGSRVLITL